VIPHSKPCVGKKEWAAVQRVIVSGHLAQGKEVGLLEAQLCALVGHRYGLTVSSGTAALYGALRALGVRNGDAVVIPSYACTALANAVCMVGAVPAVCDVEYDDGQMSVSTVKAALVRNTRAVIVPHLFGYAAPAHRIERELGVPVVEDCAQCIGAEIDGRRVGSLTSIAVFSFYATKVIAAGEGGMIAATDSLLSRRLEEWREYDNRPSWEPRFNFKCSDVHAAIARAQLGRLPAFIRRRRSIARGYLAALPENPHAVPFPAPSSARHPICFRFLLRTARRRRAAVARHFTDRGIACVRPVFKPFHRYLHGGACPATERLHGELVSLPIYPALTEGQCRAVERALAELADRLFS
jgi:perosamine synthetase